ncbi:uncharacterized protein YifN (PemK superfamily) [Edaphobacter lichenicola]|uniref:Uncharacterized protein YifN (PemK superfamily) n=1 Tax=Tunturiibacter gelidiferens TaxID=3069689 RepID=A0A9X0QCU8_9BACT|nr:uncharacterized protein YifN (PemK superfamily) [Edaphobacter lichenicola]
MHYRKVIPHTQGRSKFFRQTLCWLREEKAMQADRARLTKATLQRSMPCSKVLHLSATIEEASCEAR